MEKIIKILRSIRPDIDFLNEEHLVDNGKLDSFDIIAIVGEINEFYEVKIGVEDLIPENFNSADAILKLIHRLSK